MAAERQAVQIDPDSELGERLAGAAESHQFVLVDAGETRYALTVTRVDAGDVSERSEAERIARTIAGIRRATGGWAGLVEFDALLEDIYSRRRAVSMRRVD